MNILSKESLKRVLNIRDLSNPMEGDHAIQLLLKDIANALQHTWDCEIHMYRESPIVSIADNYDKLKYPADGPARAAKYTRYLCDTALLRTSTSAMVPRAMRALKDQLTQEALIICPGLVYRRDCIDRLHLAEIHQVDLWRITEKSMTPEDLQEMIHLVVQSVLPDMHYRTEAREHPYTLKGLQIDLLYQGNWIEIGECGLAHPEIIAENLGEGKHLSGLAMGLGLDRLLMLRKGMHDIRLVASSHPKIAPQMLNLNPYQEVSSMPAVRRDLSLVIDAKMDAEQMGDIVRDTLGKEAVLIESLEIIANHPYETLPINVQHKLGIEAGQTNVLLRVVLQALDKTLTDEECNELRDRIYACLHEGPYWEWAVGPITGTSP